MRPNAGIVENVEVYVGTPCSLRRTYPPLRLRTRQARPELDFRPFSVRQLIVATHLNRIFSSYNTFGKGAHNTCQAGIDEIDIQHNKAPPPSSTEMITRTTSADPAMTTTTVAYDTASAMISTTAQPDSQSPASVKLRQDLPGLPEMPAWAVGLLAGLLSFGLVLAIFLYLVNFPPGRVQWLEDLEYWWRRTCCVHYNDGYTQMGGEELQELQPYGTASGTGTGEGRARKRAKDLNIDTSRGYPGLGIAIPGEQAEAARSNVFDMIKRRDSFHEARLQTRPHRPVFTPPQFTREAATAPIPATAGFDTPGLDGSAHSGSVPEFDTPGLSGTAHSRSPEAFDTPGLDGIYEGSNAARYWGAAPGNTPEQGHDSPDQNEART
ncbi:hypothetical protein LTR62_008555 [Meristemomyces frigidus]|uniref:Uncharacterized protein n=1 Tax=Meristemomyces frigidus TaxID=1508187 RepID=A0AAN7TMR9_9PEZI|nr:hypothetical protein LTR62_008555 [Meristemomyces frigidus]